MDAPTLYMLVICANQFCSPVESVGAYDLTLDECESRVAEIRNTSHLGARCYSSEDDRSDTKGLVVRGQEFPIVVGPR